MACDRVGDPGASGTTLDGSSWHATRAPFPTAHHPQHLWLGQLQGVGQNVYQPAEGSGPPVTTTTHLCCPPLSLQDPPPRLLSRTMTNHLDPDYVMVQLGPTTPRLDQLPLPIRFRGIQQTRTPGHPVEPMPCGNGAWPGQIMTSICQMGACQHPRLPPASRGGHRGPHHPIRKTKTTPAYASIPCCRPSLTRSLWRPPPSVGAPTAHPRHTG